MGTESSNLSPSAQISLLLRVEREGTGCGSFPIADVQNRGVLRVSMNNVRFFPSRGCFKMVKIDFNLF